MGSLIISPFNSITDKMSSHRSSQAFIYKDMLECDIDIGNKIEDYNTYDSIYVYHGNDFFGSLNLFGGTEADINIWKLSNYKGKVYSLGIEFPDYVKLLQNRISKAKTLHPSWNKVNFENLEKIQKESIFLKYPKQEKTLVIGDSHSICMYRPGVTVNSVPFKTLHGALSLGLKSFIDYNPVENLEFYFGNIDIRHHICRFGENIEKEIEILVDKYLQQTEEISKKYNSVSIYELLPIENESRVVPKSGYYKGTPFYGSWQQRTSARNLFNNLLEKKAEKTIIKRWTSYLQNDKNELDFKYMEKPRSIHLSREFYPYWTGKEKLPEYIF